MSVLLADQLSAAVILISSGADPVVTVTLPLASKVCNSPTLSPASDAVALHVPLRQVTSVVAPEEMSKADVEGCAARGVSNDMPAMANPLRRETMLVMQNLLDRQWRRWRQKVGFTLGSIPQRYGVKRNTVPALRAPPNCVVPKSAPEASSNSAA